MVDNIGNPTGYPVIVSNRKISCNIVWIQKKDIAEGWSCYLSPNLIDNLTTSINEGRQFISVSFYLPLGGFVSRRLPQVASTLKAMSAAGFSPRSSTCGLRSCGASADLRELREGGGEAEFVCSQPGSVLGLQKTWQSESK